MESGRSSQNEDSPEKESLEESQSGSGSEGLPQGLTYSLNSKRLKAVHLQHIAESLGLPTQGTVAVTRQLIEGKLMEMGHEPRNVQVVIQGMDNNSVLFLIDEDGIIDTINPACDHVEHVSSQLVDAV